MIDFVESYVTFDDVLAAHGRVTDAVTRLVGDVDPARLDEPSGLGDWTFRRLVTHLADIDDEFANLAETGQMPPNEPNYPDPIAAVGVQAARAGRAFAAEGYLETVAPTPIGPQPGKVTVQHVVNELLTHGLDLARGLRTDAGFAPDDVERVLASWRAFFAGFPRSAMGVNFSEETSISDEASAADRLLAYLGRDI
ncbi:TIGR03086 family metal-binding protein [Stackebrandtia soli]|uniref:TIGR03086 family metal-binding protein n=1 Tax=Stackebrandtia soli TaxID=1892856 RepID=UPI0039E8F37E